MRPSQAKARITRPSRGRGRKFEAEPSQGSWVTEAKPRRDRLKNCLEAASSRDSCLEDYISGVRVRFSSAIGNGGLSEWRT